MVFLGGLILYGIALHIEQSIVTRYQDYERYKTRRIEEHKSNIKDNEDRR